MVVSRLGFAERFFGQGIFRSVLGGWFVAVQKRLALPCTQGVTGASKHVRGAVGRRRLTGRHHCDGMPCAHVKSAFVSFYF